MLESGLKIPYMQPALSWVKITQQEHSSLSAGGCSVPLPPLWGPTGFHLCSIELGFVTSYHGNTEGSA